jgi:transposase
MSLFGWKKRCRQLEAENARLQERNAWLEGRLAEVEARNQQLVQALAAAKKTSANSSKPPSSDIVKPPPKNNQARRKRRKKGGQPGHPRHEHPAFAPEQVDQRITYPLKRCPVNPFHRLVPVAGQEKILQQVELVDRPFLVTEHVAQGYWCAGCQRYHYAPFPAEVAAGGLCGPRLTSLVSYLKGKLHSSYSGIRDFFADVLGLKISRGYAAKLTHKAAQAFAQPYLELMTLLPQQAHLNADETGHKENGQRLWTWCFRAKAFVVFKIAPSRGSEVLMEVLGPEFQGTLGADFYGAYRKYARQCGILIQFCLAHLVREVKYLCEFPDPSVQHYGQGLLGALKKLFATLHQRDQLRAPALKSALRAAHSRMWEAALEPMLHPHRYRPGRVHRLIDNLCQRFLHHGEGYFRFITSPEIDPTNNSAEQAMRFVVMDRHMTQGTRSERGRAFCERIWTVIATCTLQKRSVYDWMHKAVDAYFHGRPAPSLLEDSS